MSGSPADIVATNLRGTWLVLLASQAERVSRVTWSASAQVFGFAERKGSRSTPQSTIFIRSARQPLRHVQGVG